MFHTWFQVNFFNIRSVSVIVVKRAKYPEMDLELPLQLKTSFINYKFILENITFILIHVFYAN